MIVQKRRTFRYLISLVVVTGILLGTNCVSAVVAQTTIKVWKMGGTARETEFWPEVNEKFEKENPDIKLEYGYFYGQIRRTKIIGGYQTGNLADVVIAFGQDIPDFVGLNIIQPLDEINVQMVEEWRERIVPEIWDTCVYKDHLYAFPTYVDMGTFLAYNLDVFEKAGIAEPPKNWEELKNYAKKLTTKEMVGIALQASKAPVDINIFEGIAYANGGRVLDEEEGKIAIDGPGFVDTLRLYVDLIESGLTNKGLTDTRFKEAARLFGEGKAAMWPGLSWLITPWYWPTPEGLRWKGTLFPRPASPTGGYPPVATIMDPTAALMVTTFSMHPEAALKYVNFWTQPEQLSLWNGSREVCRVPAYKEAFKAPELEKVWPEWVRLYETGELFRGSLSMPHFLGLAETETNLINALQKVVIGKMSPKEALEEAAKNSQEMYDILYQK